MAFELEIRVANLFPVLDARRAQRGAALPWPFLTTIIISVLPGECLELQAPTSRALQKPLLIIRVVLFDLKYEPGMETESGTTATTW
ncbi:MAG TPA: hypothetical protein VGX92_19505 [Pyrinomonadaceae bacterium]|nr:hypothetical protein [Pyrinomonadaceae bacterium]